MAQTKTKTKYTYHNFDPETVCNYDRTTTCCGVLEVGEFPLIRKFNFLVPSREVNKTWIGSERFGFFNETPCHQRKATYEEVLKGFKNLQDVWSKHYGMGVLWFRPEQQQGDFARLFTDLGWEDQGAFWNPNTRRTLHMWTKTFRQRPPRKKKTSKSILGRR